MRKIRLSDTDFEFFDYEVQPSEFQFFQKHKEAFLCMWKDQGKPFWTKFTITFRSFTVKHGIIKQMSTDLPKFDNLVDQAFIYIHENFVDGKESMARGFIDDIARLAQNHDKFPALDSKSFARDPFYIRETRELFRKFFGTPDEKASYLKVYILSPIYLRFGGSVCRCIKKWLDAPEIHPDDESYWTPPNGSTPCPRKVYLDIMCTPCLDACWDLYNKEKSSGNEKGPKYITCWKLGDPRFNDPKNPLYNLSAAKRSDWREDLKFEDFRDFLHFAKLKYGTDSEKCQDCLLLANCEDENATECPLEKQKKKKKKKKNKKKQNEENENNNTTGPSKETSTSEQGNGTDTKVKTGVDASTNFPSPKKDESSNTGNEMEKGTETSSGTDISQTNGSASLSPRKRRIVFSSRATIAEDYKYGVMSTQDHRHPNSVDSHLVLGFRTIITEEKGKIETRVIVSTLKNKDREIIHKREGMTVNTLLLNAEMIKSKVENLPFKMEWWEGNCFCICVLDYEREERAICRKKKGKQYPTNFSLKVSNADDETCKMIMFKLLMYVGKRKKRESLGWTMTEEDVMTCVEAEDMKEHEGLTVSIMKGFRFEDRLSKEEEKSLFQPGIVHRHENKKKVLMLLDFKAAVAILKQEDGKRTLQELIESGETDIDDPTRRKEDFKLRIAKMISNPSDFRILTLVNEDRVDEMQTLGLKIIPPEDKDKYKIKETKEELQKNSCTDCGWPLLACKCHTDKGTSKTTGSQNGTSKIEGLKYVSGVDFEVFSKALEEQTQKTENFFKFSATEQSDGGQKKSPKKTDKSRKKKDRINFFYQGPTKDGMTSVIEAEIVKVAELPPMPEQGSAAFPGSSAAEWKRVTRKIFEDVEENPDNEDDDVVITELDDKESHDEKKDSVKEQHQLENGDVSGDETSEGLQNGELEMESKADRKGDENSEDNHAVEQNDGEKSNEADGVKNISRVVVNGDLRHCANCDSVEPRLKTYKKCQKCKVEGITNARYYCGRECQIADWNARHKKEHKEGLLNTDD